MKSLEASASKSTAMTIDETRKELKRWSADFITNEQARIDNAALLVKIIDAGAMTKDEIADEIKVPVAIINRIERIGRRKIHPSLLFRTEWQYTAIARMPIEEQSRYIEKGVELLTSDGSTLRCDVDELQPTQAKQVFAYDQVRSTTEQKKWIEEQKTIHVIRAEREKESVGYQVIANSLVVRQPMTFSRSELKKILQEM